MHDDPTGSEPAHPLASRAFRIPFDAIEPEHVVPGVRDALARAEAELESVVASAAAPSFEATLLALDDLVERLTRTFGVARHLTQVASTPALRQAYNEVLPEYSGFLARLATHEGVWAALKAYAATPEAAGLTGVRRRHLDKTLMEFRRAGADLPPEERRRAEGLRVALAQLSTRFSENVLDGTNAFEMVLTEAADIEGLPESFLRRSRADAQARGLEGWRVCLQAPSYLPYMKFAHARERRRELYQAFVDRAAHGEHDNRELVGEILARRRELAELLGYRDYADLQLEDRMVKLGSEALAFERELTQRTEPYFRAEVAAMRTFARAELGLDELEPWDLSYVAESMRRARFEFDDEALRPYFALDAVLEGAFEIARRLFGVVVERVQDVPTWHPDVEVYDVRREDGTLLGSFYADWFPRESKRGGAWMNPLVTGLPGSSPHVGVVVTNFTPPEPGRRPQLTHGEVTTLFHEFGHLLHHLLSDVEIPARSSMSVAWDFVELPSQILENWAWEREGLDLFAHHADTGEPVPADLYERLWRSRTFLEGVAQMRQLSFGTVDLALHIDFDPTSDGDPIAFGQRVMEPFSVRPDFARNHFLTAFSHVFAGGYAAGYYSYKWSEVLDADAFGRFRREGIFNRDTGRAFVDTILSRGDSEEPDTLFRAFMGRGPDLGALLERNLGPEPEPVVGDD